MPPTLFVHEPFASWLAGPGRAALARQALAPYLAAQRWFPAKARTLAGVAVEDLAWIDPEAGAALLLVAAEYAGGGRDRFALPVSVATGDAAARILPARVIADLRGEAAGVLHDDMAEQLGARLLEAVGHGERLAGTSGILQGEPTRAFAGLRGVGDIGPVRRITAEQSNTSVVLGERLILKVIRRLEPGLNPDYEVGRHLTDTVRFPGVPALAGALTWRQPGVDPVVAGVLQAFVPGATVLREEIVAALSASMRAWVVHTDAPAAAAAWREQADASLRQARALGHRTAALHLALADARGDDGFTPEPVSAADLRVMADGMRSRTADALDLLASRVAGLPADVRADAGDVLAGRDRLLATVDRVADVAPGLLRIRVHGDYQLDQVLSAGGQFVIIDFEGEPLRPLAERRAKFLALKDVAGMLRSFSYAAYAALFEAAGGDRGTEARLDPLAREWQTNAGAAFVAGYRETAGGAGFLPADPADAGTLLQAFLVEKATYELRYELNHRPAWLRIPLRGIAGGLQR